MPSLLQRLEKATGWYPKGISKEERVLVRKLDALVLSYACLSFFAKYLDVSALTNAYVSGMKEDLDLYGNRLNHINAAYAVGYVVFQIPSNLLITKFPAQYYLPLAEIFWGFFTLGTAFCKTYNQIVVTRFFVGFSATSKSELGRRNALFWIANPLGQMIAGYLQAAAYTNLNNNHGLQGWRWLFIICFIITIPIALIGIVFFPDMPERTKSRWLTEAEKKLAVKRLQEEGFAPPPTCTPSRSSTTSAPSPTPAPRVSALVTYYTDLRGKRWEPMVLAGVLCVFANIVLAVGNVLNGLKFFAYIAVVLSSGLIPVLVCWTAEGFASDLEARAVTLASYNCLGAVTGLVVPLVAWPVSKAPGFRGGFIWATLLSAAYLANVGVVLILNRRDEKKAAQVASLETGSSPSVEEVRQVDEKYIFV
ncbi:hypothetical protein SCUCBS95973_007829 [Sporothrix curviconia]|uniref:Major facilitator superfamily (MFS) profile domain-containing protein n=1 Tax=Sporothrix curviconia TaxID=1260050 RepID=A0ABP0CHX4_9PEZI